MCALALPFTFTCVRRVGAFENKGDEGCLKIVNLHSVCVLCAAVKSGGWSNIEPHIAHQRSLHTTENAQGCVCFSYLICTYCPSRRTLPGAHLTKAVRGYRRSNLTSSAPTTAPAQRPAPGPALALGPALVPAARRHWPSRLAAPLRVVPRRGAPRRGAPRHCASRRGPPELGLGLGLGLG